MEWKTEKQNIVKLSYIHILAQIQTPDYPGETSEEQEFGIKQTKK